MPEPPSGLDTPVLEPSAAATIAAAVALPRESSRSRSSSTLRKGKPLVLSARSYVLLSCLAPVLLVLAWELFARHGACRPKPCPHSAKYWQLRIRSVAVVGVEPGFFGLGPVSAIKAALSKVGWRLGEVDRFEVNEAFAAIALVVQQELKVSDEQFNIDGGAIAHGHPIGATGAILVTKVAHTLCSGLIIPDTNLGENSRHREVFDEQAKTHVFPRIQAAGC
ncbi:3-oxoacyl-(acyl-carrier-protein) synthase [Herbaspirillum sp. Sphag1AN]|uniref:hypothetical protein n=1 Tax=unclassified Herbaspirillum TaxID=2624150 RepID=UPI0016093C05|nr:3-oxoacyl-(acyl-carrier-protein) synthase [Herbaspirillum sp. Sphag1AN]MBB3244281.1 3-oxoacyl-(acyl-carrier-protein) synthase [Herbaspirillum sp. Sphag64]